MIHFFPMKAARLYGVKLLIINNFRNSYKDMIKKVIIKFYSWAHSLVTATFLSTLNFRITAMSNWPKFHVKYHHWWWDVDLQLQLRLLLFFSGRTWSVQPPRWSIKSRAGALFFWHLWDCARWSRLQGWTVSRFCRDDLSYAIFHCSIIHSHNTLHRSFWPHQQNPHLAPALLTVFDYLWRRPLSKFNIQHKRSSYWHSKQIHICRRSGWSLQIVIKP